MTVPRSTVWNALRIEISQLFDGVGESDFRNAMPFYEWREKGGYQVSGFTKNIFSVSCAGREYGAMVAREIGVLLDQALEHQVLIASVQASGRTPSWTWLLVTTYYWCVFLALAWLRLSGRIVTMISTEQTERLVALAGTKTSKAPGQGTFIVRLIEPHGARFLLEYKQSSARNFHEALWGAFYRDLNDRMHQAKDEPADFEFRIFSALARHNHTPQGTRWLSSLRNAFNYRVGFGYGAVDQREMPELLGPLNRAKDASLLSLVQQLEEAQDSTQRRPIDERPDQYAKQMLLFGCTLSRVIESYRNEVWASKGFDSISLEKRERFLNKFGIDSRSFWL